MDNTPVNATVFVNAPAAATGAVSSTITPVATAPAKKAREPRRLNWKTLFQPRDWVRNAQGFPEEVRVKKTVKKDDGTEEEILSGTGKYRIANQHLPGDTIVDGNGDSFIVLPDMSLRAVSKYKRREERRIRREEQQAKLKELRQATIQSGGLRKSKRVLLSK